MRSRHCSVVRARKRLALIAGSVAIAALPVTARAITNGHDATPGAQPFMVALVSSDVADNSEAQFPGR